MGNERVFAAAVCVCVCAVHASMHDGSSLPHPRAAVATLFAIAGTAHTRCRCYLPVQVAFCKPPVHVALQRLDRGRKYAAALEM